MARDFRGAIFDVDGVLVDSPHERAWRDALKELMETQWSDVRPETSYSPERFTPQVYQQVMSGKPRFSGGRAALEYFDVPDAPTRSRAYWYTCGGGFHCPTSATLITWSTSRSSPLRARNASVVSCAPLLRHTTVIPASLRTCIAGWASG